MRIILAETGKEFEIDNFISEESNQLRSIKQQIEREANVKYSDQILISSNGVQLKESETKINDIHDTIVVFNRRLLQDPASVQQLIHSIKVTEENIEIPTLQELEIMVSIYETQNQEKMLINTMNDIICVNRHSMVDQLAREINAQTIALNAALNNLESHVRVAHQNINKFDRIAQREFAKHAIVIGSMDLDVQLLQSIRLHPRVRYHIDLQLDTNITLDKLVSLKEIEKCKQMLLVKYEHLVSATLEQKNKVTYLYQQTTNLGAQRATSEIAIQRVHKLRNQVSRSTESILEIQKKIIDRIRKAKRKDSLYLELNRPPPISPPRSEGSIDGISSNSSVFTARYAAATTTNTPIAKKNKLNDAVKTFYLHQAFIQQTEKSVMEEKQSLTTDFVHCMQSISQVEESVTKIYPKLAELEKEMKLLRKDIEKGTIAKRVISGYGILLIELWRRDKYTEIVKGNANLLQALFSEFGQLEETYRKSFKDEVVCVNTHDILTTENQVILPFQLQNIDELPIICTTFTINGTEENIVIVTRGEVEEYIQMVHLFYADNISNSDNDKRSRSSKHSAESRNPSYLLNLHLEREAKRIRTGLSKLGLPNGIKSSVIETNQSLKAKDISPSPSSATFSNNFTFDMKLATATNHLTNNNFYQQQQKDWELEKTSLLRQSQEYRRYIDDLNIKHEKDKQSLLRKLQLQEQRIEEMEGNYANQTQEFQTKIQNAEKYYKIKEEEWKRQYEATLQTEQEKYDRRLDSFHQRMRAKDQEYMMLEESYLRETKSAPSSPTSSTFQSFPMPRRRGGPNRQHFRNQQSPPVVSQEQYDHDISQLQQEIKDLVEKHRLEISRIESEKTIEINQIRNKLQDEYTAQLKQVADALQSEHSGKNNEFITLINSLEAEKKSYVEKLSHFDALKEQMDEDRTREFELHTSIINDLRKDMEEMKEKHKLKVLEMNQKFEKNESRLKSLFMNENQQVTMQCEARLANLMTEHKNNLQELKDTLDIEKEVDRIKHQTAFEELNRSFIKDKEDWNQKYNMLNKQNQKMVVDYTKFKKESQLKIKELTHLQQELKTAKRIAADVLSVSADSQHEKFDPNCSLIDLLRRTLSNVSSLKTRTSIMETMDSSYLMGMSSYGY